MPKNYSVGYRKPPLNSRFPPGRSGNPRGKPRGTMSFKTAFLRELNSPIVVEDQGRRRRMSRHEVLIKSLVNKALKGDHRSIKLVFDTLAQLERSGPLESKPQSLATDQKIMERLKTRLMRETA